LARVFLTKLRRSYIIKTLSDGNEWHTQEILKEIGDLEYQHYCYHHPPINYYKFSNFRPENIEPVNNPKLSIILGNLVKEGIIETRAISRFEKEGSLGSRGNIYWLVNNNKALYLILKELDSYDQFNLVFSEYGRRIINLDLVDEITKILNPLWTEDDKQFILAILRISPTALYNSLKAYFIEDDYWFKGCAPRSDEEVRLSVKEKYLMDLKFWLYDDMQTTPLRFERDIKVIFDVSVSIGLNNKEFKQNSKNESIDHSYLMTYEQYLEEEKFEREHKPIKLIELEEDIESLKRKVYDCLRVISEEKWKEKKHKKEELINEYYIQINKLNKRLIPLEREWSDYIARR